MRRLFLLAFLVILGFVLVNRQRVFVRDPLAKVSVNGTPASGFQVYINYSNDVLLERDDQKTGYGILVQNWNKIPGAPSTLKCIHWMACMTDADHATTLPLDYIGKGSYEPHTEMSSTAVSFVDGEGRRVQISLR